MSSVIIQLLEQASYYTEALEKLCLEIKVILNSFNEKYYEYYKSLFCPTPTYTGQRIILIWPRLKEDEIEK